VHIARHRVGLWSRQNAFDARAHTLEPHFPESDCVERYQVIGARANFSDTNSTLLSPFSSA
jgi:hypothetical protein